MPTLNSGIGETFTDGAGVIFTPETGPRDTASSTYSTVPVAMTDNGVSVQASSGGETLSYAATAVETLNASTHVSDAFTLLGNYGAVDIGNFALTGAGADTLTLQASAFPT
jgi:hypothetical protein